VAEGNWIQTVPGKGWNVILRLYSPLPSFFDQSWRPGELTRVPARRADGGSSAQTKDELAKPLRPTGVAPERHRRYRFRGGRVGVSPGPASAAVGRTCFTSGCWTTGGHGRRDARFRSHPVRHRTTPKNRIHAPPITFGHPCPVSDPSDTDV
jgi:hypothetical protein